MADVSINAVINDDTARGMRSVVFTTALIGYWFFIDGDGDFVYTKTTDGGASWGAQVDILSSTSTKIFDVCFNQWVPGDVGTLIHMWYSDDASDDVHWRTLDTNGDTLGTQRVIFAGASTASGRGVFVSGAKMRGGYLYCAFDIDAGAEKGLYRSTDGGVTWSSNLSTTFIEATLDQCLLFPASNTGDDNDCWAVYQDASTNELTLKMWDSSAGSEVESASFISLVEGTTDLTGQYGFSGSVRHSDGHLIVAAVSERDTVTSDHRVFDITDTSTISELTAITTNIDDHYHPQVFIDQITDDIYVAYNGKRDGSESLAVTSKVYYTKSTDDGATWAAGDTAYMEGAAGAVVQVWTPPMGLRFYAGWRVGTTLLGNAVNALSFSAAGIAFDAAANSGYQAAQSSYTFSRTCTGANRFLSVDVEMLSVPGTTVTSVIDDYDGTPVNLTLIGVKSTVSGAGRVESWGLAAPATGAKNVQVNLSASIASAATAVSYTGVHQTSPTEAFNSNQATNVGAADATVTVTSVANNCWIHAAVVADDTAITAGQTTRNNVTGALGSGANEDTGPITPAGAQAMSYTDVGALITWAIVGYAIRPVASADLSAMVGAFFSRIRGLTRFGRRVS